MRARTSGHAILIRDEGNTDPKQDETTQNNDAIPRRWAHNLGAQEAAQ